VWSPLAAPSPGRRRFSAAFVRTQLNPLTSRLSPLRLFSEWRLEGYYRRTLQDVQLARRWMDHYFDSSPPPAGAPVLVHGCGRGRHVALLSQLGFRVAGQDVRAHPWWSQLSAADLQVTPPEVPRLPWADGTFALVVDVEVLHYVPPASLPALVAEVRRVLQPGGKWLIAEANDRSLGVRMLQQYFDQMHPVAGVRALLTAAGFAVAPTSYESVYLPVAPRLANFLRQQAWPAPYDVTDVDSRLERLLPPERRGLWVLKAAKAGA
jgi:SAM-dependent methyltransferase